MADPLSQDHRAGKLTTPFGDTVLALSHMSAMEALSELFEFRIEAVGNEPNLDFNSALGRSSTVKFTAGDGLERYFNGLMTEARWTGQREDLYLYEIVLRPWLWWLTRTSDCRIFAQKTPLDIIKEVFSDRGFTDFRDATIGSQPTLEYCVQYRETDYNFVCRLMEEYGIYYFFEHSESAHTLVLANAKSSHQPIPGRSSLDLIPVDEGGRREVQYVETWSRGRRAQTGKFTLNDYDYNRPSNRLLADSEKPGGYTHDSMEIFDYPGDYDKLDKGMTLAKIKVEAAQSLDNRRVSSGAAPSLFPGALITLDKIPIEAENQEYLVTHCSHFIDTQAYRAGSGNGQDPYVGHYETTPSERQFRAPLVTRKPEVSGVQSALVVGKSGDGIIDVDELGRVLVQFYWDRKRMPSRRVRVAQTWAGKARGALFLPRLGDEVMVVYEEGDPDRPLVIGSVYNGNNTVPLTLPDKKNKSGILTQSSASLGYHMLLFDDTEGRESIKLRSQKDLLMKALNNETLWIGADQSETIIGNIKQSVGQDKTVTVGDRGGGNYSMTAQKKIVLTVGPSSITIDPNGVTIKAPNITFTADVSLSASAPSVSVTGDAEVDISSPQTSISG